MEIALRALLAAGPEAKTPVTTPVPWLECLTVISNPIVPQGAILIHPDTLAGKPDALAYRPTDPLPPPAPTTPPPPSDAVREAAEVVRTILMAHDARLSESGVLTYGPPSNGTGFVAAIQWLRRYDAARGGE